MPLSSFKLSKILNLVLHSIRGKINGDIFLLEQEKGFPSALERPYTLTFHRIELTQNRMLLQLFTICPRDKTPVTMAHFPEDCP